MAIKIQRREIPAYDKAAWPPNVPEVIRDIYASRKFGDPKSVDLRPTHLIHWKELGGIGKAAKVIGKAILNQESITISGDYDCDGATGTGVLYRGLRLLGAHNVRYIVPNRFVHGYGLSPELVVDMDPTTQLIVTVDSGVSSVDGVRRAKELGRKVVITDHHLQGDVLPDADALVNPNVIGDPFPSKALAGVGVAFYVMLATRAWLQSVSPPEKVYPDLAELLDLVALGTIADLVPLDHNNRILVAMGLRRIRSGRVSPGLRALIEKANKRLEELTATDFAFAVGPRLNAAGRMEDMTIGIQALVSTSPDEIDQYVDMLESINDSRKERQQEMINEAEAILTDTDSGVETGRFGVVLYNANWHSGIVGLVASKVKESVYRPVVALAPAEAGSTEIRGSCRSIEGFHLRDALALVDVRNPGLMMKFGGHAMAAGLSLHADDVERFKVEFDKVAEELLTEDLLNATLTTDGPLPVGCLTTEFADLLNFYGPWGQGFPMPLFENDFIVDEVTVLKEKHLRLSLIDPRDGSSIKGIYFNAPVLELPERVRIVYELNVNVFKQYRNPQLMVRHIEIPQQQICFAPEQ